MTEPVSCRVATQADLPDILGLYAQPDLVGKALMRHVLQLCGEKGCYKAVLSSNLKRQRAHAFYESLGFERHGYSYRVLLAPLLQGP